tara:strand:+ start:4841 stop:5296 length:456 start_codon:yes stop_codon:yes gene_type:complete
MTFALAFADLDAAAPRQRARCAATGRFVAWAKVPQLRVPGAPRVVVIASPLVVVAADGAEAAPVAPAAEVAPVAIVDGAEADAAPPVVAALLNGARAAAGAAGRWFRRKASALVAGARAALVAGALAIGDGAPPVGGAGPMACPPCGGDDM